MVKQIVQGISFVLYMVAFSVSSMAQSASEGKNYEELLKKLAHEDLEHATALADSLVGTSVVKDTSFFKGVYNHVTKAMQYNGQQQKAMELAQKIIPHYAYENAPFKNLLLQSRIAESLRNLNQHDSAENLFNECLEKVKTISGRNAQKLEMGLLTDLGVSYGMRGQVKPSMKAFLKADSLALVLNSEQVHMTTQEYLGNLYFQMEQFEEAAEKYATVRAYFLKEEAWRDVLSTTDNLAAVNAAMGNFEQAIELLNEARGYAIELNDKQALAMNYSITAETYEGWKKYQEAVPYFEKAIHMLDSLNLPYQQVTAMDNYAKTLAGLKQFQKAIDISLEQQKLAQTIGHRINMIHSHFNLWHAWDSLGNQDQAYHHVQWYWYLRDSFNRSNFNSEVAMLQNSFETQLKEAQIEKLELENQLTQANAERSEAFNKWLMIGGSLALMAVLVLFFLLRNIRKARNEIASQNQQLLKSDHEKAVLLKELHHRVKNNLQIVSSLLNMQGESVKDEKALEAFKEGQNRVDAMAMIHKHLYSTDELTSVEISGYLERLVMSLAFSYGYTKSNFQLETQITEQPIDVDVAIPIGLMVNELASNAFKHAFTKEVKSKMKLELRMENDQLTLLLEDNGKGLPNDFSLDGLQSFGLELVHTLVHQLKGQVSFKNDGGAHFYITLQPSKALAA